MKGCQAKYLLGGSSNYDTRRKCSIKPTDRRLRYYKVTEIYPAFTGELALMQLAPKSMPVIRAEQELNQSALAAFVR